MPDDPQHLVSAAPRDPWLGVELRHLAALATVARERSFSAAAERLGYVQSAVSQQISVLERLVGARLVERSRGPRPVSLTEAGTLLLTHAEEILDQLRLAHGDLADHARGAETALAMGVASDACARIVPAVLTRLHARRPDLTVNVHECGCSADLLARLESRELDVILADLTGDPPAFPYERVLEDPHVLLAPADVRATTAPERLLASRPLIGRRTCTTATGVDERLRAAGLEPHWVLRTDVLSTLPVLVRAGLGCAIVPRLAVDPSWGQLAIIDLEGLVEPRVLALFWHDGVAARKSLDGLRAEIRAACAELAG